MALEGLRELVLETNLAVHGVPATVTRPAPYDSTPIATAVIWLSPGESNPFAEGYPVDFAVRKREPERVLLVPKADVAAVPLASLIAAPERAGDEALTWSVSSIQFFDADSHRVVVVRVS